MEELIRRSDAIEALEKLSACKEHGEEIGTEEETYIGKYEAITELSDLPSADIPQGEWLPFEFGDERWHKCSCCGTADKYIEYVPRPNGTVGKLVAIRNFCPNCGCRMKGADDDRDNI